MKRYSGDQKCPGICAKSGSERPRAYKDGLCKECQETIEFGREMLKDFNSKKFSNISATWYKLEFYNSEHFGKDIDDGFRRLLKALHRKVDCNGPYIDLTKLEATTHADRWIIDTECALSIKKIVTALEGQQRKLRDSIEQAEKDRRQTIIKEKKRLFKEGVSYGRAALVQLNTGEITLADFEKDIDLPGRHHFKD